jgi:hypothetical protein
MSDYLLLESGDKVLQETGGTNKIWLEAFVPPEDLILVDVVAGNPVVSVTVESSSPNKSISSVAVVVDPIVVTMSTPLTVTTPRYLRPVRHYIWVYGIDGEKVNVLD